MQKELSKRLTDALVLQLNIERLLCVQHDPKTKKGPSPIPALQEFLISLGTDTKLRIQDGIGRNVLRVV